MKKKIIALIVLLILVAGAIFAYLMLKDEKLDANNKNIDSSQTSKKIAESSTPDGDWNLEATEDVFAGYQISEQFAGDSISKVAVGKSNSVKASLTVSGTTVSGIEVNVDMTKLESSESRRDSKMSTEGLEIDAFPEALFTQTVDLELPNAPVKNKTFTVSVVGDLILHGETKNVTFDLEAIWDGKTIKVSGEKEISLSDFGINPPDNSFVKVEDKGLIKVQLLFIPA